MSSVKSSQDMRIYDFNTLKKSMKIQDVSNIEDYVIPEENLPSVKDQSHYGCCVACSLASMLEVFNKIETGETEEMSVGYIYGKHRPQDSNSTGMFTNTALQYMLERGSVPNRFFPKLMEMPDVKKVLKERDDLDTIAIPYKIGGYCKIDWNNEEEKVENIKLAFANYNVPIVAVARSGFAEKHCFLIYGIFKKNGKYYANFQNSYGETYGNKGRSTYLVSNIEDMYLLFDHKIQLPFEDVPENAYFYKSILNMYSAGYIKGKTETQFKPNDPITRGEVCVIIDRILSRLNKNEIAQATTIDERFKTIEDRLNMF